MVKRPIAALSLEELAEWLSARGEPTYRARQVRRHVFAGDAGSFDDKTHVPKALRAALDEAFDFYADPLVADIRAHDGETHKGLFQPAAGPRGYAVVPAHRRRRDDVPRVPTTDPPRVPPP